MRDISLDGDFVVNGDFTVNEGDQNNYIPFGQCNLEQLQMAMQHHRNLASEERKRINSISFKLLYVAIFVGLVLASWYFINGGIENAMFIMGFVGVGMPVLLAIKNRAQRSEFEQRQINTINNIYTLIRERQ